MSNERLRGSLASAQLRPTELAESIGVDPKTVERWITKDRLPHRAHRIAVARALNTDEAYIWPEVVREAVTKSASVAELLEFHPSRSALPHNTWTELISGARDAIDVLVYAGTFLFENLDFGELVRNKVQQGVEIRILIGDEQSSAVETRASEEGTHGGLQGRIQLHRRYLRDVMRLPGVEVRAHGTTLYNSLFRFDQDLLVNCHVYGMPAGQSPVLHLRRVPGGRVWDYYMKSFDNIWANESKGLVE